MPQAAESRARIAESIDWAFLNYSVDPVGAMAGLEESYLQDRGLFLAKSQRLLSLIPDNPSQIALIAFLLKRKEYLALVCDQNVPLPTRIRLAKLALRVDAGFDRRIVEWILERPEGAEPGDLLEILTQVQAGVEPILRLAPLLHHSSRRVQSKVAFLLAKSAPEGAWVLAGLEDDDPRVRANVVEAFWSHTSAVARTVFERSADDVNHRVAANAVYGLYRLGEPEALSRIRYLLTEAEGDYRRAGLWLMERIRDPRYLSLLGKLIGKVEPHDRTRCLKVLRAVKARKEEAAAQGLLNVEWLELSPGRPRLIITTAGGEHLTHVRPFDLVPSAGGETIDEYRLERRTGEIARSVILLVGHCPDWKANWLEAVSAKMQSLGPNDRFGVLHYKTGISNPAAAAPPQESFRMLGIRVPDTPAPPLAAPPAVPASPQGVNWCGNGLYSLRRAFDLRNTVTGTFETAIRHALSLVPAQEPPPRLIVLDQTGAFPADDCRMDPAPNYSLDIITGQPQPTLAARCQATGGHLHLARTVDEASRALVRLYRHWHADYEMPYTSPVPAELLEVYTDQGYGSVRTSRLSLD